MIKKLQEIGYSISCYLIALSILLLTVETAGLLHVSKYLNLMVLAVIATILFIFTGLGRFKESKFAKNLSPLLFFLTLIWIVFFLWFEKFNAAFAASVGRFQDYFFLFFIAVTSFTLYLNRDKLKIQPENKVEIDLSEHKRNLLKRLLSFCSNEGWIYIILLIAITVGAFLLRVENADIIPPGRDSMHHLVAAKAIIDHGSTVYDIPYINHLLAFLFRTFGERFIVAKMPFIIFGTLSVFFIYFIGRKISKNIGLISAALLAICPWAINLSQYVRYYSLNLLLEIILVAYLLNFSDKVIQGKRTIKSFFITFTIIILLGIIWLYTQRGLIIIIFPPLFLIPIFLYLRKIKFFSHWHLKLNKKVVIISSIFSIIFIALIIILFNFGLWMQIGFYPKWFSMLFDSQVQLPMLWWSFAKVSILLTLSLVFLWYAVDNENYNLIYFTTCLIFYLIFFIFIAKDMYKEWIPRYIFAALPFLILSISGSINYLLKITPIFRQTTIKMLCALMMVAFLGAVFYLPNTFEASKGFMNIDTDGRQPEAVGYYAYPELIEFLKEKNLSKNDIVITTEMFMKDVIAWYFDFDFKEGKSIIRNYENDYWTGGPYDIADNIYVLDENAINVLKNYSKGWIVRRDGGKWPPNISPYSREKVSFPEKEVGKKGKIEFLGVYSKKFEVYKWEIFNESG